MREQPKVGASNRDALAAPVSGFQRISQPHERWGKTNRRRQAAEHCSAEALPAIKVL
jgi:hypothetical protein